MSWHFLAQCTTTATCATRRDEDEDNPDNLFPEEDKMPLSNDSNDDLNDETNDDQ